MRIKLKADIIVSSGKDITPRDILELEQLLNGDIATQIWASQVLGVRFHIALRPCDETKYDLSFMEETP